MRWLRMEKIDTDYKQNYKMRAKLFKPFNLDVNPLNQVFGFLFHILFIYLFFVFALAFSYPPTRSSRSTME